MNEDLQPVTPVTPPAPWLGGKRGLAQRICRAIAATPHAAYVEPFLDDQLRVRAEEEGGSRAAHHLITVCSNCHRFNLSHVACQRPMSSA